jgi:hypothetical protein
VSAIFPGTASSFQYQLRLRGSVAIQKMIARLVEATSDGSLPLVVRTTAARFTIRLRCMWGLQLPVLVVSE